MKGNRPAPITRLFGREAGIVEPALIEEVSGAVRTSGPCERGDRVNHKASVLCLPSLLGGLLYRCHRVIISGRSQGLLNGGCGDTSNNTLPVWSRHINESKASSR